MNKHHAGTWRRHHSDQLQKPLWALAGSLPKLGGYLLENRVQAWRQNKSSVPTALAIRALGDSLLIKVSPASLEERLSAVGYSANGTITHDFRSQFIFEGDCEQWLSPVSQSRLDSEINQLFAASMNWRETPAYEGLLQELRETGSFRHNNVSMAGIKDIDRYFERYVRLTESISQHGYKTRKELNNSHAGGMKRRWLLEVGEQEVGVAIGPDGQIWRFGGGYHRTAIACNLGVGTMPVMIRLVHGEWLRRQKFPLENLLPPR